MKSTWIFYDRKNSLKPEELHSSICTLVFLPNYDTSLENKQGQLAAKATAEARVKADLQYDALCSSIILILESSRTALHKSHFNNNPYLSYPGPWCSPFVHLVSETSCSSLSALNLSVFWLAVFCRQSAKTTGGWGFTAQGQHWHKKKAYYTEIYSQKGCEPDR